MIIKEDIEYWTFKLRAGDKEEVESWVNSNVKEILNLVLEGFESENLKDEIGKLERDESILEDRINVFEQLIEDRDYEIKELERKRKELKIKLDKIREIAE